LRQPFLRYITGDAGHLERLYNFVKVAQEFPDRASLQREILSERNSDSEISGMFTGIKSPRSFEPHQALARELDILERGERWRVTSNVGKPFITLWEEPKTDLVRFLLLAQFLRYDRALAVPFIKEFLKGEKKPEEIIERVWNDLWKYFPKEMELAEPPLPRKLRRDDGQLKRTCNHHAMFRLRFLTKKEGLGLDLEQISRITEVFENYRSPNFPTDYYSKIGFIFGGEDCKVEDAADYKEEILRLFKTYQSSGYASVGAVFHHINAEILPVKSLDSKEFLGHLRSDKTFSLSPSSKSDDMLFTIRGKS